MPANSCSLATQHALSLVLALTGIVRGAGQLQSNQGSEKTQRRLSVPFTRQRKKAEPSNRNMAVQYGAPLEGLTAMLTCGWQLAGCSATAILENGLATG